MILSKARTGLTKSIRPIRVVAPKYLRVPLLVSVVALFLAAVGSWPYDFYILLRVAVFSTCSIEYVAIRQQAHPSWSGVFLVVGFVYNYLIPITCTARHGSESIGERYSLERFVH
jgi:phosphotransferase system  glucose/maltose/N-acetylglucosamine-specific IIC component